MEVIKSGIAIGLYECTCTECKCQFTYQKEDTIDINPLSNVVYNKAIYSNLKEVPQQTKDLIIKYPDFLHKVKCPECKQVNTHWVQKVGESLQERQKRQEGRDVIYKSYTAKLSEYKTVEKNHSMYGCIFSLAIILIPLLLFLIF